MPELPGRPSFAQQVFGKAEAYDFVLAPLAVLTLGLSAYDFAWRHAYVRAAIVAVAGTAVLVAGVAKAAVNYDAKRRVRQTHELEGCLETLHEVMLADFIDVQTRPTLRLTLHKPVDGGQRFEQLVDYVGDRRPPGTRQAGRRFPAQSGVTGRALRRAVTVVADRVGDDVESLVDDLAERWAYTEADARRTNTAAYAWLAIPLFEVDGPHRSVLGVVYFDCTARGFFTPERITTAQTACRGIARFAARRYRDA